MKNKLNTLMLFSFIAITMLFTACDTELNKDNISDQSSISRTASVYNIDMESGNSSYITVTVKDFKIIEDKITDLNAEPFKEIPDFVDEDGNIKSDYDFAVITLSLLSETNTTACVSGSTLMLENNYFECFYNDSPVDDSNTKQSGYVELTSNTEKEINIGFFINKDSISDSSEFIFYPQFVDTGEEGPSIDITDMLSD